MTQRAIVAGVAGPDPEQAVKSRLIEAARCLGGLALGHAVPAKAEPTLRTPALLDAVKAWRDVPSTEGVWLVVAGVVAYDEDEDEHQLAMSDGVGLGVERLARLVKRATAGWRVVVLDVPETHADALRRLDWGHCALLAIGPGVIDRLVAWLLREEPGPVRAGDAPFGRSDAPDRVLNVRVAGDVGRDEHAAALVGYLEGLRRTCDRLALDVQRRDESHRRGLGDVYVAVATDAAGDRPDEGRRPSREETEEGSRKSAHDRLAEHRTMFLIGDPGSGKTSFLHRVTAQACDAALEHAVTPVPGLPGDPLPVFFELRRFSGEPSAQALFDQAVGGLTCAGSHEPLPAKVVERALAQGRLVLLFDGLDEVTGADARRRTVRRRRVAKALGQLADGIAANARIVVTCRPAAAQDGATPGPPFHTVTLRALDDRQIAEVATRWLSARDTVDAARLGRQLVADLRTHPAVYLLARNPLTLAMICIVIYRRPNGRLPRDRNALYDELVNLLLEDRERDEQPEDPRDRRVWITDLALTWWLSGGNTDPEQTLTASDCEAALVATHGLAVERARQAVSFFDERAGLLVWREMQHNDKLLRFAHRSFAEFLVACRLVKGDAALLRENQFDANWRDVLVMYVAEHARQTTFDRQPAWDALGRLLERAEDAKRSLAERATAAAVAAEALRDWRDDAYAAVPEALLTRLDACQSMFLDVDSAAIPVDLRARFWLQMGRHNRVVERGPRWVPVPAGVAWRGAAPGDTVMFDDERPAVPPTVELTEFALHAWPVTVEEFRAFIEADGYTNREWWSEPGWAWRADEGVDEPEDWPRPDHWHQPVVGVSWWEAEAWCAWATATGLAAKPGWRVLLPSEAQWEYAARGPYREGAPVWRYPWGVDDAPEHRNGRESQTGPTPPGTFPGGVGPFGAWDHSGNVWEWCRDARRRYEAPSGPNPLVTPTSSDDGRVLRGGAFLYDPRILRVSSRFDWLPQGRFVYVGIRCVCVPPQDP